MVLNIRGFKRDTSNFRSFRQLLAQNVTWFTFPDILPGMPTAFDNIFVPLATQLVDQTFGFNATHRRIVRSYDASTGKNSESVTDTTVKITPPSPFTQRQINDTTILQGDQQVIMSSASGIVPNDNDKFVIGGNVWKVVAVNPIVSGELSAAYTVQLRN